MKPWFGLNDPFHPVATRGGHYLCLDLFAEPCSVSQKHLARAAVMVWNAPEQQVQAQASMRTVVIQHGCTD